MDEYEEDELAENSGDEKRIEKTKRAAEKRLASKRKKGARCRDAARREGQAFLLPPQNIDMLPVL